MHYYFDCTKWLIVSTEKVMNVYNIYIDVPCIRPGLAVQYTRERCKALLPLKILVNVHGNLSYIKLKGYKTANLHWDA